MNCQTNTNTSTDKKCDNLSNNGDYNNQINEDSFYKDNTTHYKKKNIKKLLAHMMRIILRGKVKSKMIQNFFKPKSVILIRQVEYLNIKKWNMYQIANSSRVTVIHNRKQNLLQHILFKVQGI